jgi:gas vesicle protein
MKAQFRVETADLKKRYEDSINLVQDASNNLSTLFQHKMVKIKDKISRFFGETDIHLNRINTEMLQTSKLIK